MLWKRLPAVWLKIRKKSNRRRSLRQRFGGGIPMDFAPGRNGMVTQAATGVFSDFLVSCPLLFSQSQGL